MAAQLLNPKQPLRTKSFGDTELHSLICHTTDVSSRNNRVVSAAFWTERVVLQIHVRQIHRIFHFLEFM
jgi:hypothetical protein